MNFGILLGSFWEPSSDQKSSDCLGAFWDTRCSQNDDVLREHFGVGRRLMANSSPTGCDRDVLVIWRGSLTIFGCVFDPKMFPNGF